ncbi:MAG TPA: TetR/AcrR family transcriptional regulator C-terminal domain-containing protein [Jatrophihabitans sp.]
MTPTKDRLDRETVVTRAIALADAEGIDALTIRRLAADFHVTPMALYWHFKNKDELFDGIAEQLFRTVVLPDASGTWADRLRACLSAVTSALRPHPAIASLTQSRLLASESGLVVAERALGLLDEAGFTSDQAAEIGGYLVNAIVTLITAEPGRDRGAEAVRHQRAMLGALSPDRFPHVIAAADALSACADDDAYYARGIGLLITGAQGLVETGPLDVR